MALPRLTDDLNIIQQLPDEPNTDLGMSPAELKAEFDEAGNKIKEYINTLLLEALESSGTVTPGAGQIGAASLDGSDVSAPTVQAKLGYLLAQLQGISQGAIPDGTITTAKLADNAVTATKILDNTITPSKLTGSFELGYAGSTGGTPPAYTATKTGFALVDGAFIVIKCHSSQSAAATLNVNGLGAKGLKAGNGTDVLGMVAGGIYSFRYNTTTGNFILQGSDSAGSAGPAHVLAGKTFSNDTGPGKVGTLAPELFNCISGGSFDAGEAQTFWTLWAGVGAISQFSTEQVKSGSHSVKIVGGTQHGEVSQSIRLIAGRSYYCSAWMRRTGVLSGQFDIVDTGAAELDVSPDVGASLPAENVWTLVSGIVTATQDADARIRIYQAGTGTLFVDSMFVQDMAYAPGLTKADMDAWANAKGGVYASPLSLLAYHQFSAGADHVLNQKTFLRDGGRFTGSMMGGIKSIQHGYSTLASSVTSLNVAISTVDLTKAVVMLRVFSPVNAEQIGMHHFTGTLTSATQLTFLRATASANAVYMDWHVIEFENIKSLQTIEVGVGTTTIGMVNTAKTMVLWSARTTGTRTDVDNCLMAYLLSATQIVTVANPAITGSFVFRVHVIEFY